MMLLLLLLMLLLLLLLLLLLFRVLAIHKYKLYYSNTIIKDL